MKNVLLLHTDQYYLVRQVYPYGLDLVARHLRRNGYGAEIAVPLLPDQDLEVNLASLLARTKPCAIGLGLRNLDTAMACERFGDHEGPGFRTFFFPPGVRRMVEILKRLAPETPLVLGGCGFTVAPAAVLEYLDLEFGIAGEGEEPLLRFLQAHPNRDALASVPNLAWRRDGRTTIAPRAAYDFTDRDETRDPGFAHAFETTGVPVRTRRGCNRACSYCVEPLIEGRTYRFRDPFAVVQEIQALAQGRQRVAKIFFADTEFNLPDLKHATELLQGILKAGLHDRFRFVTQCSPKPLDRDFAQLAAEAGLSLIMSCESFDNQVLEANGMDYRSDDIVAALEICEEAGLDVTVNLIFGLPGETWGSVDRTVGEMLRLGQTGTRRFEYTVGGRIYPGTPLHRHAARPEAAPFLHGPADPALLAPSFYCAPAPPLELKAAIDSRLPFAMEFLNRVDPARQSALALGYLADRREWDAAAAGFAAAPLQVQAEMFDYLFRTMAAAGNTDGARRLCGSLLEALDAHGDDPAYSGQLGLARFYASLLPS